MNSFHFLPSLGAGLPRCVTSRAHRVLREGEVRYSWKASASHSLADYTLRQAQGTAFTGQYSYMDDPSTSGVTEGFARRGSSRQHPVG